MIVENDAITVVQIIADWLNDHGYDGLCCDEFECGCPIHDLMMCELNPSKCVAAHKELADDGDWRMFPGKRLSERGERKEK